MTENKKDITKLDQIVRTRATELSNAQRWVIRSELEKILRKEIAFKIASNVSESLFRINYTFVNVQDSDIKKIIDQKSKSILNLHDFIVIQNDMLNSTTKLVMPQVRAIMAPLEKYLTYSIASETTNNIMKQLSQWNEDFIVLIFCDISEYYGLSNQNNKEDE